jgi:hypothetical protein
MDPLAIEIISPDDRDRDVEEKVALYLPYGTLHVVVDPQTASITIQEPGDAPRTTSRSGSIDVTDDLRLERRLLRRIRERRGAPVGDTAVVHHETFATVDLGIEVFVSRFRLGPIDVAVFARRGARFGISELRAFGERVERLDECLRLRHEAATKRRAMRL